MPQSGALSSHDRLVASLVGERDELQEKVRQLEELVSEPRDGDAVTYVMAFGLTLTEARVFATLMRSELAMTERFLVRAVWDDKILSSNLISVMIHKIRKKVNGCDIAIETVRGRGYLIKGDMKAKVRRHMAQWYADGQPIKNTRQHLRKIGNVAHPG